MQIKLGRLNVAILGFALICVTLSVTGAYFVTCSTMSEPTVDRYCHTIFKVITEPHGERLKRGSFAFLDKLIPDFIVGLGKPIGLCYVYALEFDPAPAEGERKIKISYGYLNRTFVSEPLDERSLENYLNDLDELPSEVIEERHKLSASKREIIDIIWPLSTKVALRMGFLTEEVFAYEQDIRQNLILVGVLAMFITSIGVMGLNNAVNKRVTRIVYEQREHARNQTKKEVLAEVKKAQRAEARKADDSPLESNEFFGILDFAKTAGSTLEIEEILVSAVTTLVRVMSVKDVMVYMVDEMGENLQATVGHDANGIIDTASVTDIRVPVGQGEIGSVAELGGVSVIDVPSPGAAIAAAIISRGQVLGVFRCKSKVNGRPFGRRDKLICRQVSEILGNALYNTILYVNK